jgi:hypothetical protein
MALFSRRDEGAWTHVKLRSRPAKITADATASPRSLLSIGALVSGILLSSAVIVWTATRKPPNRR